MRDVTMKSEAKRLCDIKSLNELRSVRRANESAINAAKERVCANAMGLLSFERFFSLEKLFKSVTIFKWWR